jgi:DNA repair exonuclease SbcCD ATPase subunit
MKSLWIAIVSIAIMNVVAIAGTLGWLGATDRLSRDRLAQLRKVFSPTIEAEKQEEVKKQAEMKRADEEKAAAERLAVPPTGAAERIEKLRESDEHQSAIAVRQRQELETLRTELAKMMADLDGREKKLAEDRAGFDADRRRIAELESSKQFKDALATLEGQKARDAMQMLRSMLGKPGDQAISYLARMEEGKRSKVLAEFIKEDPNLAADLLERLRTRGTGTGTAQTQASPGAANRANTGANSAQGSQPVNSSASR